MQRVEETAAREAAEEKEKAERKASLERLRQQYDALEKALRGLNVKSTIDEHIPAKQIELPGSQSNGEDSPLDELTSKGEITCSINNNKPKVEAGKIWIVNPSRTLFLRKRSSKIGQNSPSLKKKSVRTANHDFQVASFFMRDVYMDTGQMHGGQGGARLSSLANHRD
ncbi:hypothetical protein ACLB2K_058495 [Fragaria x ananassa]